MEMQDFMSTIIQIVLIPLLTALTGVAVKWINSKANEIKVKTDNTYLQQCIEILDNTITTAVIAVNQTYVEELKKAGEFNKEAQEEAFNKVFESVQATLTEEAVTCLQTALGDLEEYISNKIEESVVLEKLPMEEEIEYNIDEEEIEE